MKDSTDKSNQGVIVKDSGSVIAEIFVVGENASIVKTVNGEADHDRADAALKALTVAVSQLVDYMEQSESEKEKLEAAKLARAQLESDSPNLFVVKSLLLSVIEGVKTVGAVAGSIVSIKKLLEIL